MAVMPQRAGENSTIGFIYMRGLSTLPIQTAADYLSRRHCRRICFGHGSCSALIPTCRAMVLRKKYEQKQSLIPRSDGRAGCFYGMAGVAGWKTRENPR